MSGKGCHNDLLCRRERRIPLHLLSLVTSRVLSGRHREEAAVDFISSFPEPIGSTFTPLDGSLEKNSVPSTVPLSQPARARLKGHRGF